MNPCWGIRSTCCTVVVCVRTQHPRQQQHSVDSVESVGRLRTEGVLGDSRVSAVKTVIMDDILDRDGCLCLGLSMLGRCRVHSVLYGSRGKTTALCNTRVAAVSAAVGRCT